MPKKPEGFLRPKGTVLVQINNWRAAKTANPLAIRQLSCFLDLFLSSVPTRAAWGLTSRGQQATDNLLILLESLTPLFALTSVLQEIHI